MKKTTTMKSRLLASITLALGLVNPVLHAQTVNPDPTVNPPPDTQLNRVIVTGSYIPSAEGEAPVPVTTYTQADLVKFGANTVAEGLRMLPSFVGNTNTENDSNGGNGTANINLRAVGPENTLVLIDGRRAGLRANTTGEPLTDLNAIPYFAIDHVDILKDGASAVYGTDAVAGVVNIVLRKNYSGVDIDLLYGNTTNNDAGVEQGAIFAGISPNDKLDVVFSANYYNREAIFSRDRNLSSLADQTSLGGVNTGSSTFPGRISTTTGGQQILVDQTTVPTSAAAYRPYDSTSDPFNFRQYTPAIPEQHRDSFYGAVNYKIFGNALEFYASAIHSDTTQYNGLAPSPGTFGSLALDPVLDADLIAKGYTTERQVIRASAFNPVGNTLNTVRYRTIESGDRESKYEDSLYHFTFGFKGEIAKDYNWDIGFVHDEADLTETDTGDVQRSKLVHAIANNTFNPFRGLGAPLSGVVNGVAYNNQAAVAAAGYTAVSDNTNYFDLVDAKLTGTVFKDLPQEGISFNIGAEHREEGIENNPSPVLLSGDNFGFSASGGYGADQTVNAVFSEVVIPIVAPKMHVPGIYRLEVTGAGRFENYDLSGNDPTTLLPTNPSFNVLVPKVAVAYQPIEDLKFRGSFSQAYRAPGLAQLFATLVPGADFPEIRDPASTPANGIPQQYQPSDGDATGGNPALKPEKTDTYTAGIVWTPSDKFLKGFTLTLDYYQLNQKNIIASGGSVAQFVVDQNFATGAFANSVVRDSTGLLTSVSEVPFNAGRREIEGLDLTAVYELPTEKFGKFTTTVQYNHFLRYKAQVTPTSPFINFLGKFSSDPLTPGSLPYNKAYLNEQWEYKGLTVGATVNFIGGYQDDVSASPVVRNVREYTTLDSQISYEFKKPVDVAATDSYSKDGKTVIGKTGGYTPSMFQKLLGGTTIRVGVNDIFDTDPPFAAGAFNDNYDTSLYSIRNRYYYVGVTKKF